MRALGLHDVAGYRAMPGDGRRLYFRPDLMRVLTDFAHDTAARFHYDRTVTDIDLDSGTLCFTDDAVKPDGPVIAADGIDSLARARLEPDRPAVYAGQVVYRALTAGTSIAEAMTTRRDHIRTERAEVAEAFRRGRF